MPSVRKLVESCYRKSLNENGSRSGLPITEDTSRLLVMAVLARSAAKAGDFAKARSLVSQIQALGPWDDEAGMTLWSLLKDASKELSSGGDPVPTLEEIVDLLGG